MNIINIKQSKNLYKTNHFSRNCLIMENQLNTRQFYRNYISYIIYKRK